MQMNSVNQLSLYELVLCGLSVLKRHVVENPVRDYMNR